jgi:hypothetical protein
MTRHAFVYDTLDPLFGSSCKFYIFIRKCNFFYFKLGNCILKTFFLMLQTLKLIRKYEVKKSLAAIILQYLLGYITIRILPIQKNHRVKHRLKMSSVPCYLSLFFGVNLIKLLGAYLGV